MNRPAIRIFLVDDHPLVRDWLNNLLSMEQDLEVVGEADGAAEAMTAMQSMRPDIAIVDLSLGRSSGLDLIKAIGARLPGIRVLVLTMHEEISDVERALRAGAMGYIMKSESSGQVVSAIRQINAGRIYARPEVLSRLAERMTGKQTGSTESAMEILSDRELEVFRRIGEGQSTRRIGDDLNVSQKTVQTYCARIKEKLGIEDGAGLSLAAIRWRESRRP